MASLSKHRTAFTIGAITLVVLVGLAAIFWARGFKPNLKNHSIDHTGLIVASSIPTGAQVYLDDRLTSATNTNIGYLDPRTYKVRIQKDGYTTWEKEVDIKADLATEIKVLLFPLAPEIKPLTTTGATNPTLSPDGTRIVYGVSGERGGAYTLLMASSTFLFRQDTRQLTVNTATFDFSKATFTWSPDSKQIIAHFEPQDGARVANLLLEADQTQQDLRDVTGSLTATLNSWQQDLVTKNQTQAIVVPDSVKSATGEATSNSPSPSPSPKLKTPFPAITPQSSFPSAQLNYAPTGLTFSPDEEKVLYRSKDGKYKVYDLKEKKEYTLPDENDFLNLSWYPDSEHLILVQKDLISVLDKDGSNKMAVYSGKFEGDSVFAHPTGTSLIILTTLAQTQGTPANLYSINLR